jgi:hypothetical protein
VIRLVARARRHRTGRGLASLALVAVVLGLGPGETPRTGHHAWHRAFPLLLTMDLLPPADAGVLPRVAHILAVDFALPLPAHISARVYDGPERFQQGLTRVAAVPAGRAAELARFAIGAAVPGAPSCAPPSPAPVPWSGPAWSPTS